MIQDFIGHLPQSAAGSINNFREDAADGAHEILEMLEPLVEESRQTAIRLDAQVKEKKNLLKGLNDALDSRIISINLLLSRADTLQKKLEKNHDSLTRSISMPDLSIAASRSNPVLDQQNRIIDMYRNNMDADTIAERLSIPKGEVRLVIELKEKFLAMENNSQ